MCQADLPLEMVPALLELGRALSEHVRTHRDASLDEHEQGLLEAVHRMAPRLLESMLTSATSGLGQSARRVQARCPRCQQRRPVQSRRKRQLQTRVGAISVERPWHHCQACGHGWSPSDRVLGVAAYQQTSTGLARWEALLGAITTFDEAAMLLAEFTGVHVGTETLRVQAEVVGTELEARQRAAMVHVEAEHEPLPSESDPAPGRLVVETDGVMVRYRDRHLDGTRIEDDDWHEVKLGMVGGWVGQRPRAELQAASYVAAREPAAAFARRLGAEAARRGALEVTEWHAWDGTPAQLRPVVVLGDGARWIWQEIGPLFGPERTEIVDYFHASEHVWTVAKALHGDDTPETTAWAEAGLHRLWRHGPQALLGWFDAAGARTSDAAAVLKRERSYFSTNAQRMRYPELRRCDLPIGSGAVESSAKHLVQQRMKRAGMRWSDLGARAILDLRCHLLSGRSLAQLGPSPTKFG